MFENNTQEQVENKLLMLKLIGESPALSRQEFIHDIHQQDLINFFLIHHYLTELEDSELIVEREGKLSITERGEAILDLLKDKIPSTLKKLETEQESKPEFQGEIEVIDSEHFLVLFSIKNQGRIQFSLTFEVNSYDEAKAWLTQWEERPESLYLDVWRVVEEWKMKQH